MCDDIFWDEINFRWKRILMKKIMMKLKCWWQKNLDKKSFWIKKSDTKKLWLQKLYVVMTKLCDEEKNCDENLCDEDRLKMKTNLIVTQKRYIGF